MVQRTEPCAVARLAQATADKCHIAPHPPHYERKQWSLHLSAAACLQKLYPAELIPTAPAAWRRRREHLDAICALQAQEILGHYVEDLWRQ
jgi:hypothetical protein